MFAMIDEGLVVEWAGTQQVDAAFYLSRLVRRLVLASLPWGAIRKIDFPDGSSTWRPGVDGRLVTTVGCPWAPLGESIWEVGVRTKGVKKADEDYAKRLKQIPLPRRAGLAYVAVSAASWTEAQEETWRQARRGDGWSDVGLLTASRLAQWLDATPSVALAFLCELGRLPAGARPPRAAWEDWARCGDRPISTDLVLAGRDGARDALSERLKGPPGAVHLRAHSPEEACGFALAAIEAMPDAAGDHCRARTIVLDAATLPFVPDDRIPLVVVQRRASFALIESLAGHHHVIVPLGREGSDRDATEVGRAPRHDFAGALEGMGFDRDGAGRRAREAGRCVTLFKRRASRPEPPAWRDDPAILPALLAGRWDETREADGQALARLAGVDDYAKLESGVRRLLTVDDPPLVEAAGVVTLTAPADALEILAPRLARTDIDRFAVVFREVFSEINPALGLTLPERVSHALHDAVPRHSDWLREGLAETLLLVAVRGGLAGLAAVPDGQRFADDLIRSLLGSPQDTRLIESLGLQLRVLMEAAPRPFLDTVERVLDEHPDALCDLLADDGSDSIFSEARHADLLWGLEILAWDPAHFSDAALLLARLAEIDPGGRWGNRPIESLRALFRAWSPATRATLDERLDVLDALIERRPGVAWDVLERVLPRWHDSADQGPRPLWRWRDDEESRPPLRTEEAYAAHVERALGLVDAKAERWKGLLEQVEPCMMEYYERIAPQLDRLERDLHDGEAREALWGIVVAFVRRHEARPDADWSLKAEALAPFKTVAERLQPNDPVVRHRWLFGDKSLDIPDNEGDWMEAVDRRRRAAVDEICDARGIGAALDLAAGLTHPYYVLKPLVESMGDAAGAWTLVGERGRFEDPLFFLALVSLAALDAFKEAWRDRVTAALAGEDLAASEKAALIGLWPLAPATWELAEAAGLGEAYWSRCRVWLRDLPEEHVRHAVDRLLAAGRPAAIPWELRPRPHVLPAATWLRVIDAHWALVARHEAEGTRPDLSLLRDVFEHLAGREDVDEAELARREYAWLPLVVERGKNEPPLALYRILGRDPAIFVDLLKAAFRAEGEPVETKPEPDWQVRAKAAREVFDNWRTLPGSGGQGIDAAALQSWVTTAKRLAAEAKLSDQADSRIGGVLAHVPADPEDGAWPHRTVREVIEAAASNSLEQAILDERPLGRRGGLLPSRSRTEGGKQEHAHASQAEAWARTVGLRWPRTRRMLYNLAERWRGIACYQDEVAARRRLDL
ncbi:MAG: hypothetical protein KDG89_14270 [Geminicoccaceae bacterium]|nr:hypothetical protein [Geminicoccaceae bacterium]